jgi:hypothetical protein
LVYLEIGDVMYEVNPEDTNWSGEGGISPEEFRQIVRDANERMKRNHAELVRKFGLEMAMEIDLWDISSSADDTNNDTGNVQSE